MPLPEPPYRVRTAGRIEGQPWHSTPGTRGSDVMLTVVLAGRGRYRGPEGDIAVGAGMVGLVPPARAGLLMADPVDPYLHYYCRFAGRYAIAVAEDILARRGARFFPCEDAVRIADILRRMGQLHRAELPDEMGLPEAALAEALATLRHGVPSGGSAALTADALEEHLRARLAEPTDLRAIAKAFGVSRTTLCRRARAGAGCGVQQLHERLKMRWAGILLMHGLAVAECARRVGYSDRRYFTRVFRKHHGRAPSAWPRR
jgi:AraC-like DNA-binding protein